MALPPSGERTDEAGGKLFAWIKHKLLLGVTGVAHVDLYLASTDLAALRMQGDVTLGR